jgi:hypothetical protein
MKAAILAVLAAILGGCASYRAPEFSVTEARAGARSNDGVEMFFTLDARNDNDVALPLRDVKYRVELDGRTVFSGTRSAEATLRRLGTQKITLPAVVRLDENAPEGARTGGATLPYRISGTVTYVTPGQIAEILFDTGVRVPTVGFEGEGQIALP